MAGSTTGTAADSLPAGSPISPNPRLGIQSISDVVFGLALGFGSVLLAAKPPANGQALLVEIGWFGFSFILVLLGWVAYRRIAVAFPFETQTIIAVNAALLFTVALEPFLFYLLAPNAPGAIAGPASTAFALDLGSMMLLLSALGYLLLREERREPRARLSGQTLRAVRTIAQVRACVACIYLISALPVFGAASGVSDARQALWYVGLLSIIALQSVALAPLRGPRSIATPAR